MCRNALLFLLLVFTNNLIAQYDKRSWDLIGPVKTWHRQDYSCDDEGNPNYSRPRIYNRYAEFNIYGWETLHIDRGYEWKHNNGYDSTVCYFKDDSILIRREFYRGKRVVKYEMFKRKDIWLISEGFMLTWKKIRERLLSIIINSMIKVKRYMQQPKRIGILNTQYMKWRLE